MTTTFERLNPLRRVLAQQARNSPPFRGKRRLLRRIDWALRGGYGHPAPLEDDVSGVRFQLNTEDLVDYCLMYEGAQQRYVSRYFADRIRDKASVFWDIGGNVGSISLAVAARCPNARIFAFEPSPPVHARFQRNLALNPKLARQITVTQCALSDASGEVEFFVSNEFFNSGVGGLARAHNREASGVKVRASRGDDLIAGGMPGPAFIKIDVEGFEREAIGGLSGWLKETPGVEVLFEHSPYRFRERSLPRRTVVDVFEGWGYEVRQIDRRTGDLKGHSVLPAELDQDCDLVARRK